MNLVAKLNSVASSTLEYHAHYPRNKQKSIRGMLTIPRGRSCILFSWFILHSAAVCCICICPRAEMKCSLRDAESWQVFSSRTPTDPFLLSPQQGCN